MLQEIAPHRLVNEYLPNNRLPAQENSPLIIRKDAMLLCRLEEGRAELPAAGDLDGKTELRYLIAVDETRFYMPVPEIRKEAEAKLAGKGFSWHDPRELRYCSPAWLRYGTLTAWQAAGWYRNNRYCGRCGALMKASEQERSLVCPECGNTLYPKLCPVVITAVTDGDRILLTKYADRSAYNRYALVAGFAEIGETIEETVAREVMEETGLKVKNLRYYRSQPWAYSESLLFGFFCEADGSREIRVDGNELSTAVWTRREDVPDYGDEISLTHEMMQVFKREWKDSTSTSQSI